MIGDFVFHWDSQKTGVLTNYNGKPEIPVGKSNSSRHFRFSAVNGKYPGFLAIPVEDEISNHLGCDLQRCSFSTLFSLFCQEPLWLLVQLILFFVVAGRSPNTSNFTVLCLYAQDFHSGGLCKW